MRAKRKSDDKSRMEAYPPPLPADPNVRPPVHPARGWLLVVLGLCLSAGMAYLANLIHGWILHNGEPGAHGSREKILRRVLDMII